jgi:hypothetical protein
MVTVQFIQQLAGDLLETVSWTVDDYGGDAMALARDLVSEHCDELRGLSDDDWGFLVYTLAEMATHQVEGAQEMSGKNGRNKERARLESRSPDGQACQDRISTRPAQKEHATRRGCEQTTPSKWYYDGGWRDLASYEVKAASWLRRVLATTEHPFIVAGPISDDPAFNAQDANFRAALHSIADEICREDLYTLYNVAHLLFASSRGGLAALETIVLKIQHSRRTLHAAGFGAIADDHCLSVLAEIESRLALPRPGEAVDQAATILTEAWQESQ